MNSIGYLNPLTNQFCDWIQSKYICYESDYEEDIGEEMLDIDKKTEISINSSLQETNDFNPNTTGPEFPIQIPKNAVKINYIDRKISNDKEYSVSKRVSKKSNSNLSREIFGATDGPELEISASEKKKLRELSRGLTCVNCETTKTPLWRRTEDRQHSLCNACGLYYKQYSCHRPLTYKSRKPRWTKNSAKMAILEKDLEKASAISGVSIHGFRTLCVPSLLSNPSSTFELGRQPVNYSHSQIPWIPRPSPARFSTG